MNSYTRKSLFAALISFCVFIGVFLGTMCTRVSVAARDADGDFVIVLDPGHGGYDSGTISVNGDYESFINWEIVRYFKAELETYSGVKVYLTRSTNDWNTYTARAQLGQRLGVDLIISLHNNSSTSSASRGFLAYGSVNPNFVEVTKGLCLSMAKYAKTAGLSVFDGGYFVRVGTVDPTQDFFTTIDEGIRLGVPTILVEQSFLSNPDESAFMHEGANRVKVGYANARAVAEYYGFSKRTITDGGSVTLERSYSVQFVPTGAKDGVSVSFASSDTNVAYVREDGLITAVNAGSANVSYTCSDGSSGNCTINVNPVRMVGVAAGINPTVYRSSAEVAAIDTGRLMVKAIYSDGTVKQTNDYTVGIIDPNYMGRQNISVSSNGFTNTFMINLDTTAGAGNYSEYLYQTTGAYEDSFVLPPISSLDPASGNVYTSGGFTASVTPPEVSSTQQTTSTGESESTSETVSESTDNTESESAENMSESAESTESEDIDASESAESGDIDTSEGAENTESNDNNSEEQSESTQQSFTGNSVSEETVENITNTADDSGEADLKAVGASIKEKGDKMNIIDIVALVAFLLLICMIIIIILCMRNIKKNNRSGSVTDDRLDDSYYDGGTSNNNMHNDTNNVRSNSSVKEVKRKKNTRHKF